MWKPASPRRAAPTCSQGSTLRAGPSRGRKEGVHVLSFASRNCSPSRPRVLCQHPFYESMMNGWRSKSIGRNGNTQEKPGGGSLLADGAPRGRGGQRGGAGRPCPPRHLRGSRPRGRGRRGRDLLSRRPGRAQVRVVYRPPRHVGAPPSEPPAWSEEAGPTLRREDKSHPGGHAPQRSAGPGSAGLVLPSPTSPRCAYGGAYLHLSFFLNGIN